MTNNPETHAAIDQVARRFTAGTAPADLRANVLSRLPERTTPAWWREPRMALAAALVLIVALGAAVIQMRETVTPPRAPVVANMTPPLPSPASASSPALVTSPVQADPAPTAPSEVELAWRARALPALRLPGAMTFEDIQPDTLVIPLLDVTPIVMPPIALPSDGGESR